MTIFFSVATITTKAVVFALSVLLMLVTLRSAARTLLLPRGARDPVTAATFSTIRRAYSIPMRWANSFAARDAIMAYYAPVSFVTLLPVWLCLTLVAFMGLFWATGVDNWYDAFVLSGSSLFTLGFASDNTFFHMVLAFAEATIGLIFVALLIAYLPTVYATFSTREAAVSQLDVRAGTPPSVQEMVIRFHRIGKLHDMHSFWRDWEVLFSQIQESHTSLPVLVFMRSPKRDHSWVTAAGNVLDAAAFVRSTVDVPRDSQADLCIRSGYLALRAVAEFFGIRQNQNPSFPGDPISVTRAEYDAVYDELSAAGVPLKADREQAWRDFAGWRVNYDQALIALCSLTMAPPAPWSADRAPALRLPPLIRRYKLH